MSAQRPAMTIMVDAGGEPWSRVEPLLDRRVEEIPDLGEIEVVTADPGVRAALRGWCDRRGAALDATAESHGRATFRIRVPARDPAAVAPPAGEFTLHAPENSAVTAPS